MSLSQLPINQIEGSLITKQDGTVSSIIEYFPKDFSQMDYSVGTAYCEGLKNQLLTITNHNSSLDSRISLLERMNEAKKKEIIKFYSLENRFFVESSSEINILESRPANNYFHYFPEFFWIVDQWT